MTISRMQQPRQLYGLGSFVKSIKKGVKGLTGGIKDALSSDAAKLALLGIGGFGLAGMGPAKFLQPIGSGIMGGLKKFGGTKFGEKLLDIGGDVAIGSVIGGALDYFDRKSQPESPELKSGRTAEEIAEIEAGLRDAYRNLGYSEGEIDLLVEQNMREYRSQGGRMGYAMGTDEKVEMASGIEGIPINVNPEGVKELDFRKTGGFIPPVGVKEKADDIPAMLSNNEFVFTADAVRAAGGGDIDKGAQRMYNTMKKLESKVA